MPLFVMYAQDGPCGETKRSLHRDAHVANIRSLHENGRVVLAGPLKDEAGEKSIGAMVIFDAANLSDAKRLIDEDPYVSGGVFDRIEVHPFKQVFPSPV